MSSVAIVGINSVIAPKLIEALEGSVFAGKFQFPIKAITRSTEGKSSTDKLKYVAVNYDDPALVVKELQGTDVIISLLTVNPDVLKTLESIVKEVKPKLYIPSQFGVDVKYVSSYIPGLLNVKDDHSENVRAAGIKVVDIYNGFFASPKSWLYEIVPHLGIDVEKKEYVARGDLNTQISYTNLTDLGLAIASIASNPSGNWPQQVKIQSGKVTVKDVIERYEKDHGVKLTQKEAVSKEDTLKQVYEKLKNFNPADFVFYLHAIAAQGEGKGANFTENDDELVNPGEKLWKWSKY
ncbi:hypothetical protein QFC19_009378 [Naganishia cerealis]|uniref:Uncharacterized protein n=1 Tax=Naganishia cerealis TaxID=610337 RepID=A0ACC2UWK7_9TREE|nr:hypothetical protein QFC19_009378 [Naganishia cerealis]